MYTAWGYSVESLPPLMSVEEYNAATNNAYANNPALSDTLAAASAAVRNICGWHVAPSLECVADLTAEGRLVRIPAKLITEITTVTDGGAQLGAGEYEANTNGLIRRCGFTRWAQGWEAVHIEYTAGYDLDAAPDLANIVMRIVDAALSVPVGVASETAGNVSISYSGAAAGVAASAAQAYVFALVRYKVVGSHAA